METLKLKSLSLEQQLFIFYSIPLEQQVECIYDIIDKHPKLDDFKTLLLENKLVLIALKSINEDLINNPINFKDDNHYKRNRIEGIMKHKDIIPLVNPIIMENPNKTEVIENEIITLLNKAEIDLNRDEFGSLAESIIDYIDEIARSKK